MNGIEIATITLFHHFKNRLLNVSHLRNGVYVATVTCKGAKVWSEQVVVQR
ncbi:MAG TPA: hypothetical protein PLD84_09580 [Chitinophagales bacterium]|nr:hypothetical protein [Chitinophagales bacterium]